MLVNLSEVESDKPLIRELEIDRMQVQTPGDPAHVCKLHAVFRFHLDPLGFVVKYELRAIAEQNCVRCAQLMTRDLEVSDWISLRTKLPEDAHVVLDDAEMNVRFIEEPRFDISAFLNEILELELPGYPRHEETDSACALPRFEADAASEKPTSPFAVLSKYLEP